MKKGSFELMKRINQQNILELISERGPISRVEIAEATGLTPATVTNVVKGLLEKGLVKETQLGESRGGRKPILLELNPSGAYVIGLEWGIAEIKAVLLNLQKKVVKSSSHLVEEFTPGHFIEVTTGIVADYCNYLKGDRGKISGIGVGIHGLVNPAAGLSMYAPHFKWKDIRIGELLQRELKLPIFLDNDVRMMALAEKWIGRDNFIFINTGLGIGAAIVINGFLLYGRDFCAGEFGHMTIVENGELCSCGNYGCLEAMISLGRLVREYNKDLQQEISLQKVKEEWRHLIRAAREEDEGASNIIKKAGKYLGKGIANLVNLLNPEAVIIGGDFLEVREIMLPVIKKQVKGNALNLPGKGLEIAFTDFGKLVGAIGAGTKVLQEIFKLEKGDYR